MVTDVRHRQQEYSRNGYSHKYRNPGHRGSRTTLWVVVVALVLATIGYVSYAMYQDQDPELTMYNRAAVMNAPDQP